MDNELSKVYDPKQVEEKWLKQWLDSNLFASKVEEGNDPFTIVIPPPNVTGSLHMGHALNNTLQDVIIRFRRMKGFNTLWVPGTDHGGIATQNVVDKLLMAEGTDRHKIGREKFIERMWQWRKESGDTILMQLKRLGCAIDWNRSRFTMDEVCSKAVFAAFVELFNRGLIYRGERLVNWCPQCQTALADIEVEHEEQLGKLWHIRYPLKEKINGKEHIVVATTRPETMLGDTGVAVNPEDTRYKDLVGATVILPLLKREIPIVADEAVDPTFGTGAVKVTPAHDPVDFEIAKRAKLPQITVIDFKGKMTNEAGSYSGLDRYEARKKVLLDLQEQNLLLETAEHPHSIGHCYRCNSVIEPLISEQWFLNVEEMSKKAMNAVSTEKIKFYPQSWAKPYLSWLENLKDWCISRQIWWGHRIPVYYCKSNTECPPIASVTQPEKCPNCGGTATEQDPDVLDTWFSSALWPFSVFGWPDSYKNELPPTDLMYYYPTSVLVTGHEILYLWVARMVQMGIEFLDEVPFREVLLNGIVRDKSGKKMSKSLGNVVDPLVVMDKFGTDALRFALTQMAAPGRDMQISDDSFLSARNFANKLWNASRFIHMHMQKVQWEQGFMAIWPLGLADQWILSEYRLLVHNVNKAYEEYNLDQAARSLYDFFWTKYCDWFIEIAKIRLNGTDEKAKKVVLSVLVEILSGVLRMLHPIMPFVTEEIWHVLSGYIRPVSQKKSTSIIDTMWPESDISKVDEDAVGVMELLQKIIVEIRTIRSEMNVPPGKKINCVMNIPADEDREIITGFRQYLKTLAGLEDITIGEKNPRPPQSAVAIVDRMDIYVPLAGLIDLEKERKRIEKDIEEARVEEHRCRAKLANADFKQRAPAAELDKVNQRLLDAHTKITRLESNLKSLN